MQLTKLFERAGKLITSLSTLKKTKVKLPRLKIVHPRFIKMAPKQRMEIVYQLAIENAEAIKLIKSKSGWNICSTDMLNDWDNYQKNKMTRKWNHTVKRGTSKAMKLTCGIVEEFQIEFIRRGILNVFMFGEIEYAVVGNDKKYKYVYVINVRLDRTYNYVISRTEMV